MIKKSLKVGKTYVEVLLADNYAEQEKMVVLWLVAPEGTDAQIWFEKTDLVKYEEESGAAVVCAPGGQTEGFYADEMREAVFSEFKSLGSDMVEHRILGLEESGYMALEIAFKYAEKFGACVAVCPKNAEDGESLVDIIKCCQANGKGRPRSVISDTPEGQGEAIGNKINDLNVDCHVHAGREVSGWKLMDFEIMNCMAHLHIK